MKKYIALIILLIFSLNLLAQNEEEPAKVPKLTKDPETKKILDKISKHAETFETMRLKFTYTFEDIAKGENDAREGIVYIKKKKYKLFLENTGVEIMFDEKTKASYSRTETEDGEVIEEVTYTTPDTSDVDVLDPSNIYTFYEENFYYRTLGHEDIDGVKLTVIDFIPEKRGITLSKVRLKVNEKTNEIYSAKSFSKSGQRLTIKINEIKTNIKIVDKLFIFNEEANPNVEIIDLRE